MWGETGEMCREAKWKNVSWKKGKWKNARRDRQDVRRDKMEKCKWKKNGNWKMWEERGNTWGQTVVTDRSTLPAFLHMAGGMRGWWFDCQQNCHPENADSITDDGVSAGSRHSCGFMPWSQFRHNRHTDTDIDWRAFCKGLLTLLPIFIKQEQKYSCVIQLITFYIFASIPSVYVYLYLICTWIKENVLNENPEVSKYQFTCIWQSVY